MTPTPEAVYEAGVFRPLDPVELPEGQHMCIVKKQTVGTVEVPISEGAQSPADVVAEISSLAVRHGAEETSCRDHDNILYSPVGAR